MKRKLKRDDLDLIIRYVEESITNFIKEDESNIESLIEDDKTIEIMTFDHLVILTLLKIKMINKLSELYEYI